MIPCFFCARKGCKDLPHPGCGFIPAAWKKYIEHRRELAVIGRGGLRVSKL